MKIEVLKLYFSNYYLKWETESDLKDKIIDFIESKPMVLDLKALVDYVNDLLQTEFQLTIVEFANYLEEKELTIKDLLSGKINYNELVKEIAYNLVSTMDIDLAIKPIKNKGM